MESTTILHLGGSGFQLPLLQKIKDQGFRLLLADQNPSCPGREYANQFLPISTTDRHALLEAAEKERVDGVLTYASDVPTPTVAWLAQQLGLQGHPPESAALLQRKDQIRLLQQDLGLPTPEFRIVPSLEEAIESYRSLGGSVIFKPVDSSGSRGQSILHSEAEVADAFHHAMQASRCKIGVMERFLEGDTLELDGDLLIHRGEVYFSHCGHNYFSANPLAQVPIGEVFPGFFDASVSKEITRQFNLLIDSLELADGCLNFDGILSEGQIYLIDIGLRNGGNYVPDLIKFSTGYDLTLGALNACLGLPPPELSPQESRYVVSYLLHARFPGQYAGFTLPDTLEPYFIEAREYGDQVLPFTEGSRAFGALFFDFHDRHTCLKFLPDLEQMIQIHVGPGAICADTT